jgi:hypothetical protein
MDTSPTFPLLAPPATWGNSMIIAHLIYYRIQRRRLPSPIDYADYMRRARWKACLYITAHETSSELLGRTIVDSPPPGHDRLRRELRFPTIRHRPWRDPLPTRSKTSTALLRSWRSLPDATTVRTTYNTYTTRTSE